VRFQACSGRLSFEAVMIPAVALPQVRRFEPAGSLPNRSEVLMRYRHFREISKAHHHRVMKLLSKSAILQQARRLGLSDGRRLILDDMDELMPVFDLAIHTAPADRSRAIDRYARKAPPSPGSDEALVLDAMRSARFALLLIEGWHEAAGLIAIDIVREEEIWLVDEGLEISLRKGTLYATRYFTPDGFSMTAGVGMPVDLSSLTDAFASAPHLLRKPHLQAIEDPRCAEAVYRTAIADGVLEGMTFLDPATAGQAA
jgi:hypothetical protein